MTRDVYFSMK